MVRGRATFRLGSRTGRPCVRKAKATNLDRALASSCFRDATGMAWCLSVRTGLVGKLKVVPLRAVHHEPFTMWFNRAVDGLFRSMQKVGSVLGAAWWKPTSPPSGAGTAFWLQRLKLTRSRVVPLRCSTKSWLQRS